MCFRRAAADRSYRNTFKRTITAITTGSGQRLYERSESAMAPTKVPISWKDLASMEQVLAFTTLIETLLGQICEKLSG
jgi:hypothetical protein